MRTRHIKPARLSLEDWADLSEDEEGELVDGALVEEEIATLAHELAVVFLLWLFGWVDDRGGFVLPSAYKYAVGPSRGRKPDLSVYLPGRPRPADDLGKTPPDIVVEVIAATPLDARRDRIEKRAEYARFGVHWYWLVDPAIRTVEIFELEPNGRYAVAASRSTGVLAVPGCRGLKLDIDKLWAHLDRR